MTRLLLIPLFAAVLALSGCVVSGKNAAKTPATPAAPPAMAAAKPPAPPPPLSFPQTEIQLPPPPQSVPEAALATIPTVREELPAPEPDEPPEKPPTKNKPAPAAANATKPETPAPAPETPPPAQGPVPPVTTPVEEQPRLLPVYPEEERRRISGMLEKRRSDIEAQLGKSENRMSTEQKSVVQRIRSFLSQAEDMAKRGDFRSAEALSDRAVILWRDVTSGR